MLLEADEGDLEVKMQEGVEAEMGVEPEISLHAFNGCIVPKTMRIQARIGSLELIILIDSISTHNFIQDKVVVALKLTLTPMQAFNVKVANRKPLNCNTQYEEVNMNYEDTRSRVSGDFLCITVGWK